MKKLSLAICIICFFYGQCKAQSLFLKVDSIVVDYLPWSFHSRFSINENDFLSIDKKGLVLKRITVCDSFAIKDFISIELRRKKNISPVKNIDVRMCIKVYASNYKTTVLIDKSKMYYKNFDDVYIYSPRLFEWIDKYVTLQNK